MMRWTGLAPREFEFPFSQGWEKMMSDAKIKRNQTFESVTSQDPLRVISPPLIYNYIYIYI